MTTLQIRLPEKLAPVFEGPADVRGAFGGRGSGKTKTFARMAAVRGLVFANAGISGLIVCGREFQNSLSESSFAEVKAAIESEPWLKAGYEIGEKFIRTRCRRVSFEFIGLYHNLESVKSKARILILWVDEAEPVTERAWMIIEPTIREEGSELWVTWNPEGKRSDTDTRFRRNPDPSWKIVEINWRDNPWFPEKLDRTRVLHKQNYPEQYDWVWEGGYRTVYEGAYYAEALAEARKQGRIKPIPVDKGLTLRTYHDLAGAGDKADNYAIWVSQFSGQWINWIGYYEARGQASSYHTTWLKTYAKDRGFKRVYVGLPHDGDQVKIDHAWSDIWNAASDQDVTFDVKVFPNQGKGAAMKRIEAGRNHFHRMNFDPACEIGLDALEAYHEHIDDKRKVGLGPLHDWASHGADAFGLGACDWKLPDNNTDDAIAALLKMTSR